MGMGGVGTMKYNVLASLQCRPQRRLSLVTHVVVSRSSSFAAQRRRVLQQISSSVRSPDAGGGLCCTLSVAVPAYALEHSNGTDCSPEGT